MRPNGINITVFADDDGKGEGKLMWVSGESEISIRFPNGVGVQLGHEALEMFADAFDDALGRRKRKKKSK